MGVQNKAWGRPPWEGDLAAKTRKKEVNELGTWERDQPMPQGRHESHLLKGQRAALVVEWSEQGERVVAVGVAGNSCRASGTICEVGPSLSLPMCWLLGIQRYESGP